MVRGHIPKAVVNSYAVESRGLSKVKMNADFTGISAYFDKRSVPPPGSLE